MRTMQIWSQLFNEVVAADLGIVSLSPLYIIARVIKINEFPTMTGLYRVL